MFELLIIVVFIWLSIKFLGLAFKITWGLAKVFASILFLIALPALAGCVLFASGIILLLPVLLVLGAIGVLCSSI